MSIPRWRIIDESVTPLVSLHFAMCPQGLCVR
jgi:hypothetical protein